MRLQNCLFSVVLLILALSCACSRPPAPKPHTLSAAQEYFLKICREEIKVDVIVIPVGKTIWIYVPVTEPMFSLKPASKTPQAKPSVNWTINFLESAYSDKVFTVQYDIGQAKRYDKNPTYENKYADDFSKTQREILTALTRAYFDVGATTVSVPVTVGTDKQPQPQAPEVLKRPLEIDAEPPPEFFVMVFADIKSGVALKAISYFQDMKMALSGTNAIPGDEYGQRYVYELYGDEQLIGDTTGTSLELQEIKLADFLAKQIENRIKFKFTQSGFPPQDKAPDAIWTIVSETCRLYGFADYQNIKLIDLATNTEMLYEKTP